MRLLNTLYATDHGTRLGHRRGSVTVARLDGSRAKVPMNALDGIVLAGRVQASSELLAECVRRNVRLSALTGGGRIRFCVGGPVGGNVHLRVAQLRACDDVDSQAALARSFVAGKLQNCRRTVLRWQRDADDANRPLFRDLIDVIEARLVGLATAHDGDRIRGIEGDGSRRYFRALAMHLGELRTGFYFSGRSRRPPRDPVNALMSFMYGLVLAEVVGALDAVGLDPQIGFLHGVRSGRPSLALDVLEEFRSSIADRFVVRVIARRQVVDSDFTCAAGGAWYLSDDGRKKVLRLFEEFRSDEVRHVLLDRSLPRSSIALTQATLLSRHLRGDLPTYPPYVSAE